jgi:galactokinase
MEVAAATALKGLFHTGIGEKNFVSRLAASNALFFEKSASPVDYLLCLAARKDHFLVIDESTLELRKIRSPLGKYRLLVMDSRVPRIGVENELRQRRSDLKKGLELLGRKKSGASFKNYATADLVESMGDLPERVRRRSMHVVQEIRRVAEAEDALKRKDLPAFARVLYHSHESLRDLYEVSCPEIDWLVKRAQEQDGAAGARMTGDGFGGCTYAFIKEEAVEDYRKRLEDYERIFGFHPLVYEFRLGSCARIAADAD